MSVCNVFKNDVPFLMSSNHMKQMWLTDSSRPAGFPLLASLTSLSSEERVALGFGALLTNAQQWTPEGRHELAHIWGQKNPFHLSSRSEQVGLINNIMAHAWKHTAEVRQMDMSCRLFFLPLSPHLSVTEIAMSL